MFNQHRIKDNIPIPGFGIPALLIRYRLNTNSHILLRIRLNDQNVFNIEVMIARAREKVVPDMPYFSPV